MSRRGCLHPFLFALYPVLYSRMEGVIDGISTSANQPPATQGDHGSGLQFSIRSIERACRREMPPFLSVNHLSAGSPPGPFPSITPANSFRVVCSPVFGAGLPLLPDASSYSSWDTRCDFVPTDDRVSRPGMRFIPPSRS